MQQVVVPFDRTTPAPGSLTPPPHASSPAIVVPAAIAQPPRTRTRFIVIGVVALVLVGAGIAVLTSGGSRAPARQAEPVISKVDTEIALADERIAAGRLVGTGGDEALDHLLAAKALDPEHAKVKDRLATLARKFEQLADQAVASGSLAEAAAHLQTVLLAEPGNEAAAQKMADIEQLILAKQREVRPKTPPKKKPRK